MKVDEEFWSVSSSKVIGRVQVYNKDNTGTDKGYTLKSQLVKSGKFQ